MMVLRDRILVGRREPECVRNSVPSSWARTMTERIQQPFRTRLSSHTPLLWGHNVVALLGMYGRWRACEWQTWDGLGERVDPHLSGLVRLDGLGLRVVHVPVDDPVVLCGSWQLCGADDEVVDGGTVLPSGVERLRQTGLRLEQVGVRWLTTPTLRKSVLDRVLTSAGYRLDGPRLVVVGDGAGAHV